MDRLLQLAEARIGELEERLDAVRAALRQLAKMKLAGEVDLRAHAETSGWLDGYEEEDEDAPFFSEAYLYCLLGKEAGRSVLAAIRPVQRAAGLDRHECG